MAYKIFYLARRNPMVSVEDWPRTWRSHAKFASQYPVIPGRITHLSYCNRVVEPPTLDGSRFDPTEATRDYDGVAVVSSASTDVRKRDLPAEDMAAIYRDELRVFSTTTPHFSLYCKEEMVLGGEPGQAAVIRFLARKSGSTREDFLAQYNQRHAEFATRAVEGDGAVQRFVNNVVIEPPPADFPFDAISDVWFANDGVAARSMIEGTVAQLAQDLSAFCDLSRSVTMLTNVIYRWPRN